MIKETIMNNYQHILATTFNNEQYYYIPSIPSYYAISETGNLISFRTGNHWKTMKTTENGSTGYFQVSLRSNGKTTYYLHELIFSTFVSGQPTQKGLTIDHKDHDKSNNTKENLRVATKTENQANKPISKRNTSGFKGVTKSGNKWYAQISIGSKETYLGTFELAEDAAMAYNDAALTHFGSFALLNGE